MVNQWNSRWCPSCCATIAKYALHLRQVKLAMMTSMQCHKSTFPSPPRFALDEWKKEEKELN
jgi:hypothetical protein